MKADYVLIFTPDLGRIVRFSNSSHNGVYFV